MANTRTSTKRARQALSRQTRNQLVRSTAKTSLRGALDAFKSKDPAKAQTAYALAVKTLSKAASKGAIPKGRAARKISRLSRMAKKAMSPEAATTVVPAKVKAKAKAKAKKGIAKNKQI
jgi:small subunit ribosomal protein S20